MQTHIRRLKFSIKVNKNNKKNFNEILVKIEIAMKKKKELGMHNYPHCLVRKQSWVNSEKADYRVPRSRLLIERITWPRLVPICLLTIHFEDL